MDFEDAIDRRLVQDRMFNDRQIKNIDKTTQRWISEEESLCILYDNDDNFFSGVLDITPTPAGSVIFSKDQLNQLGLELEDSQYVRNPDLSTKYAQGEPYQIWATILAYPIELVDLPRELVTNVLARKSHRRRLQKGPTPMERDLRDACDIYGTREGFTATVNWLLEHGFTTREHGAETAPSVSELSKFVDTDKDISPRLTESRGREERMKILKEYDYGGEKRVLLRDPTYIKELSDQDGLDEFP